MIRHIASHLLTVFLIIIISASAGADLPFQDIDATWAQEPIIALWQQNIISEPAGHEFRPNDPITRSQWAQWTAAAFAPVPKRDVTFTDIDNHPARRSILELGRAGISLGEPGQSFLPEQPITRAELAHTLIELLRIYVAEPPTPAPSFTDVPQSHPTSVAVETAFHLRLLPPYVEGVFQPTLAVTRAEAAAAIYNGIMLQRTFGTVVSVEGRTGPLFIKEEGHTRPVSVPSTTYVYRNGRIVLPNSLRPGDQIELITDRFGNLQMIMAAGIDVTPSSPEPSRSTDGMGGLLEPADITSLFAGDWPYLQESFRMKLQSALVTQGIAAEEAEAIIERDWDSLKGFGKVYATDIIASQLGVSETLARAILSGNWDRVKQLLAEENVVQAAITEWLDAMFAS